MKLISMTDFVLEQNPQKEVSSRNLAFIRCEKYANFLSQPLTLGMFAPCDENDVPLDIPFNYDAYLMSMLKEDFNYNEIDCMQYQQAKERVLFEGFEIEIETHDKNISSIKDKNGLLNVMWNFSDVRGWVLSRGLKTVEDLVKYDLTLTESAKQHLKQ